MIKNVLFIPILLFCNTSSSQEVKIGQDAQEVRQLVLRLTNNHNKPDSYGNIANSLWTCDTKYYNGVITEVLQCYQNQYLYDLSVYADYCEHYMMENNKLSNIIMQFENISIEKLQENYNSKYSETKIGDFYFFNHYESYSKIYLSDNGLATIEIRKTIMKDLPKSVQQILSLRLKDLGDNEADKEITYEPKVRKMLNAPKPNNDCNEQGKVVVQISVNRLGTVIKAIPGINGTTNNAKCLLERAKEAALKIKMEPNQSAPETEVRNVNYTFSNY